MVGSSQISCKFTRGTPHVLRNLTDPLVYPKCSGAMRINNFIDQADVIEKILQHLGLWEESLAPPDRDLPKREITFDPSYNQLI